jgi:hypothetical protein
MNANENGLAISYGDIRLPKWFWDLDMTRGAKMTFSLLACCTGGRDHAWPSQTYLADKQSLTVRTVQRHLNELVRAGLISKIRKYIKGKIRCVYQFLINAQAAEGIGEQLKKMSPCSPGPGKNFTSKRTVMSCRNTTSMSCSYKDESIKENEYIPPTPQTEDSISPTDLPSVRDDSGKGEDIFFEPEEDQSRRTAELEEDPAWKEAKEALAARLSDFDLKAWIEPLRFERSGSEAVLRLPNRFFLSQVRNKFGHELSAAFQKAGFIDLRFEEMTPEQKEAFAKRCEAERLRNLKAQSPPPKAQEPTDFEKLSLEEKFDRLYEAYPVKKDRANAWAAFRKLDRKKALPAISELLASIKDHQNRDRWWREKMPPLLVNWLAKEKWEDKPYE